MRIPEWQGWVALGALVAAFVAIGWWLMFSPLPAASRVRGAGSSPRARHLVATLVLASGVLFTLGARWDELWHRIYGGFGDDFLWPPHLLMYVGLGLNLAFAVAGIAIASGLRRAGGPAAPSGLRARFRAEPAIAFLGLMAAFQVASIPSDLIWHEIIGPDLTAWSLPHVLLAATTTAVLMAGVGLSRARAPEIGWRADALTVGILATSLLAMLQVGTTEWDWAPAGGLAGSDLAGRPVWAYPMVAVAVGVLHAVVARTVTGRAGAASAAAAVAVLVQAATVVVGRIEAPPGPSIETAMAVAYGTVAMDLWWRFRDRRAVATGPAWARPGLTLPDAMAGTAAWLAGFSAFGLAAVGRRAGLATPDSSEWIDVIVAITVGAVGATVVGARVGPWLASAGLATGVGAPPTPRPVPVAPTATPSRRGPGRGARTPRRRAP